MSERMADEAERALPPAVKALLWEYPAGQLTWEREGDLIIGKVLMYGDWESVRWLIGTAGHEGIRQWLERRRGRGLDARRLRFWENILGLKHREVSQWIEEQKGEPWAGRLGR